MTDVTGTVSLSEAELRRQLDLIEAEKKARAAEVGAQMLDAAGEEFLTWLVENSQFERTASTGRLGADYKTIPFKVNGKVYTLSIHVTDVVETERGKIALKVAQREAEALAAAAARNKALDSLINGE